MKKIWVNKANSFEEAGKFDKKYYRSMSKIEKLDTMQFLREIYHKMKGSKNAVGKRLRRIIKIIQ